MACDADTRAENSLGRESVKRGTFTTIFPTGCAGRNVYSRLISRYGYHEIPENAERS